MAEITSLEPLIGRWATTITMITPDEQPGETYRAIDTYRWMPGRRVVIHEVEARMSGETVTSLEIYTEADGQVVSRNFDASGEVSDYQATMKDGVWMVTGTSERFKSTSVAPDRIEGLWRRRDDDRWSDWMTVKLERIA